ncbi:MAG TPA: NAD(P)/FAD-dependent oxidoreductase [Caldilineaceae bacterium]|nr:NAD(P)/FAD-dependent oxidoreductase [Caldilineaceae bacterium]
MTTERARVVIIGAGFGGLFAARRLAHSNVDVVLIDRNNYHTFTPLLYQVATAALDPSEIAYPVRTIFRDTPNVRFLLGQVTAIDQDARVLTVQTGERTMHESYDYLIVATGSMPNYFGHDRFADYAFELRTLHDSIRLRNHVLNLFERAIWEEDEAVRKALLTIVVVGGGPTGIETAGAVYELYNHVLLKEYPHGPLHTSVVLVEQLPHLLTPYPPKLQTSALRQLQSLGVEVLLGRALVALEPGAVKLDDGSELNTYTVVWAAGMKATAIGALLGVDLARGGRIPIEATTVVRGLERIYAVGDVAYLEDAAGQPYPMLIPVAQQQGQLAANNILAALAGESEQAFSYYDRGTMATIGRRRAVAWIFNRFALSGRLAWLAWLGLHLVMLLGFRNRLNVLINWAWNYLTYDRSVRIIWSQEALPGKSSHQQ